MRIYYKILGGHVHCRVSTNGKCGELVVPTGEWSRVRGTFFSGVVTFIEEEA